MITRGNKTVYLIAIVMAISIVGCSKTNEQPIDIVNSIQIDYETGPKINTNQYLTVWLVNHSQSCVLFPADYGIRIYTETENGYVEFPNLVRYIGTQPRKLQPNGEVYSERSVDLRPDLAGFTISKPTSFFATITGHLCNDETIIIEKRVEFIVSP